jgi:uncharacterized protein (DUF2147 family)
MKYLIAGTLLGIAIISSLGALANNSQDITGLWLTENGEGKIRIFKCGDKYCGKTTWIRPTKEYPDPSIKLDHNNPNPAKRGRKIIGKTIMWGLMFDDEDKLYEDGWIYDPGRGKVFSCKVWLKDGGKTIFMRGFIGISLLGKTTTWTRIK